ncbi:MAG: NADH-quinone oxidoreductase subunit J family protein [Verrucomicrobiia bacterium]|jgi:NADH-quinone oxidoreductase subunit J
MSLTFLILSILLIVGATAAMTLKNLVHCALCLAGVFAIFGLIFIYQNAEFIGLIQILVYVGAVAVLILFAIMLVKGDKFGETSPFINSWKLGVFVSFLLFLVILICVLTSKLPQPTEGVGYISAKVIGRELMTKYVLPLEVVGLLLTAALIGGVFLALKKENTLTNKKIKNE